MPTRSRKEGNSRISEVDSSSNTFQSHPPTSDSIAVDIVPVDTAVIPEDNEVQNVGEEDEEPEHVLEVGYIALCYHGPMLYDADILEVSLSSEDTQNGGGEPLYYVHYRGWTSK